MQFLHTCTAKTALAEFLERSYIHFNDVAPQHHPPFRVRTRRKDRPHGDSLRLPDVKPPCLDSPGTSVPGAFFVFGVPPCRRGISSRDGVQVLQSAGV